MKAWPGEVVGVWFSFGGSSITAAADGKRVVGTETKGEDAQAVQDFDFTEDDASHVDLSLPATSAASQPSASLLITTLPCILCEHTDRNEKQLKSFN